MREASMTCSFNQLGQREPQQVERVMSIDSHAFVLNCWIESYQHQNLIRMRKYHILLLIVWFTNLAIGQTISISSFKEMPDDITAVSAGTTVLDQNGDKCALIKIETTQDGFSFDVGSLGVVKTIRKPGEIWVYVPFGVKKITISHPSFGVLRDYNFPYSLAKAHTYLLKLNATKGDIAFQAKTSFIDNNLSRTVLFTLNKNEIIYENEHFIDMSIDKGRFSCLLMDTIKNEMTYVWNGARKVNAKRIYINHNDLYDFDKCILMYSETPEYFENIKIEDKTYGPYEGILYLADPWRWADYKGAFMNGVDEDYRKGWPYKNMFVFGAMNDDYLNINGKISPIPDKYYEWKDGKRDWYTEKLYQDLDTLGISPNGKYHLKIKGNKLIGNNKTFSLPFIPEIKRIYAYDNGNAIIVIRDREYNCKYYSADLKNDSLKELQDDECFNYRTGEIMKEPITGWDRQFERKDGSIAWDVERNAICLQDPSLNHTLISKLNVPYVLVDNHKIGKGCAYDVFYDSDNGSFAWITYEDNSFVLYEYKL